MIISHEHRFIYMAVPRTASTSTSAMLRSALTPGQFDEILPRPGRADGDKDSFRHVRAPAIRKKFFENWNAYTKIANVRHPYTRCLSAFSFWLGSSAPPPLQEKIRRNAEARLWADEYESFLRRGGLRGMSDGRERNFYFLDGAPIDLHLIRYEQLREHLQQLSDRFALGLDVAKKLPWHDSHSAQKRRWTVRRLMNADAKALIDERYAWYFERFGYTKEIGETGRACA